MIAEFILLLFVASPVLCSNTYYVTSNRDTLCPGQPCLTLTQYVQQSVHYFTSNATFMFLAGVHSLHNNLALESITNVTLLGDESLLPIITSKIKCTMSVNMNFNAVSKVNITALAFLSCGKETSDDGTIHLNNALDCLLSNCIFHDNAFTALSANQSSLTLNMVAFTNNYESALRIYSSTAISVHNSTFSNNSGNQGGAAAIFNSTVSFTGTTVFESNSGNHGGSFYLQDTTARFTGISLFRNSFASNSGGVLYATFTHLIFEGETRLVSNSALNDYREYGNVSSAGNGGGIFAIESTVYFKGDSILINNSADTGGGVFADSSTMIFERGSSFINNSADTGGGVFADSSTMIFESNSSFINNSANFGGGIFADSSIISFKRDSSFINNSADTGGGIFTDSNAIIFEGDSNFINNSAVIGGGVFSDSSTMIFEGFNSFINNSADMGGGIYAFSSITSFKRDSSFINNSTLAGGGIFAGYSTMTFEGDSYFTNSSTGIGGGIYAYRSTMNFEGLNSFINNSVDIGGGIYANSSIISFKGDSSFINNFAFRAGGIDAKNSTINLEGDCSFINNSADNGGGISAHSSTISFKGDSTFINNSADHSGGGINVGHCTINFEGDCSFINNSADVGGGIIASWSSTIKFNGDSRFMKNSAHYFGGGIYADSATIKFDQGNNSFTYNSAVGGGGIFAENSTTNFDENCTCNFINNLASFDGGGITAFINTTINFDGNCQFDNNSASYGGGILVITSTVNFYGICSFLNNSAIYGGGVALDVSKFHLFQRNGATVFFTGNHAKRGGAITVSDSFHDLSQYCREPDIIGIRRKCFLQINPYEPAGAVANIKVSLFFENNSAAEGGDNLYGGTIDYCENVAYFYQHHRIDLFETLSSGLSKFKLSDISSDPIQVCICDTTGYPDCNRNIYVTTYPGESFRIIIVAVGQLNGSVAAVIQGIIDKESTANLKAKENFQSSNKTCTTLTYTVFSNTTSERIDLYAEGPCGPGVGQPLSITVTLQLCPPGFELSPTTKACICEKRLQTYTNSCDISSQTIFRADHSDFWVGYDNETEGLILHPHCPFDYCTTAHVSFTLNNTDLQCNYNRSGLLCGGCETDLSIVLGTSRCIECSNDFLALITVFALAGLLLVFFLLICRLTVAVGTIGGLIFYANIVAVNQSIFFPQDPTLYTKFLNVFIAWLNLDLGIETCFYNGMDAHAKTWLQFVFPMYIWVLVGIVIISSRYSQIVARTLGTNPVAVLATLFLLSYTKILRTIVNVLSFTNLQYPNHITRTVWLYDGTITYFGSRHIPLLITAVIMMFALFLPYTLLLLVGQYLQTKSNWRILVWVNSSRLKTIMDAYHGPYRDERRYWPGLLLVIRFILLLFFSSNSLDDPSVNLLAIITCTLGLLTMIWLIPGVYKKWCLEALEAFFILNLGIFSAATLYIRATGGRQAAIVYTSVGAAFVVFIGIVVYHIYLQVRDTQRKRKIRNIRRLRVLQDDEEEDAAAENEVPSPLDLEKVITNETRALVPTTEVVVCKRKTLTSPRTV